MEKQFVGIDLHKDFFVAVSEEKEGRVLFKERYENSEQSVVALLAHFQTPPSVVVEASGNWMWFVRLLEKYGCTVQLAHPFRTKAIASARIKTDSIDAKTLCDLLRGNLAKPCLIIKAYIHGSYCLIYILGIDNSSVYSMMCLLSFASSALIKDNCGEN